jgi:hypothetical protein
VEAHRVVSPQGSHIFQRVGSQLVMRLSALCARHRLPPEDSWYSFLSEAESTPRGNSVAARIRSVEKSNDFNGNRTHDLLAYGICIFCKQCSIDGHLDIEWM